MNKLACVALSCLMSLGCLTLSGCGGMPKNSSGVYQEGLMTESGEPAYITVQHCLIGFAGSVPSKQVFRTKDEAEKLASELFEKAKAGEDFGKIVATHTDDSAPGVYKMANDGYPGDTSSSIPGNHVMERNEMVAAFGDTGFPLEVGEVGLAVYDSTKSPFGWHIIKRMK